ncbi:UNVERIFIED_CONTAM: hypothetical protein Slati_0466100 [Sesamum latifolium]|uniref:Reverse transcriptase Ty1/copia-type domain-containing protein n=1 Tax=Sesamum latifolium TaxID=2727402 RepID=A0AAW2XWB9_9LAMI
MLHMKEVYAVPDRHVRYAATKAFFGTKMTEGSSVHSHGIKMLSLVEKLEDLKAGLDNDTLHELINMLVQYEATTHKSEPAVLVGEASTSKAKGKGARRWKRKKGKRTAVTATASTGGAPPAAPKEKGKGKVLERSRKLSKDEMILRLGDKKAIAAEAVGSLRLVVSSHIRIDLKDVYFVPNVCGPLSIPARGGFSYFITFIDDHSRYDYVYLMRYKSEAFGRFKEYRLEVENQTNRKIKALRSDRGVFLEKGFPSDSRHDEVLIEESNEEPHRDTTISFKRTIHTDSVPVLCRSTRESRVPDRYGFVGLTSQLDNDPKTYGEAMSDIDSDKWLEAIKSEMDSMGSNQLGADGEVTTFKTRLVAKGYTQRLGVDFEETYSPVAMAKSIRILLAIAAWYNYEIWQMDVKTAFLNGFVEEEIFMDQPEGFTAVGRTEGLSSPKVSGSSVAYLVLYVDDILLIGNDVKMLGDIKAWLSTQFSMKDMGEASYILGIKIYRDRSRRLLGLTQSSYIEKVLKRFKMEHSKRGLLPMRHGIKLSKKQSPKTDEELKRMSNIPYASALGSI